MIFRWVDHENYLRSEQLMAIVFDLGMASFQQLQIITGWSPIMIKKSLHQIRKRGGKSSEDKEQWIKKYPLAVRRSSDSFVYTLGKLGINYVHEMMEEKQRIREAPRSQAKHYYGINQILVRLIKSGSSRANITWLSTVEATDVLYRLWQRKNLEVKRRDLIRPDARLLLEDGKKYWIEFDNNTEGPRQLERKFHNYVQTLQPIGETSPVIWVTPTKDRCNYLEGIWGQVRKNFYQTQAVPVMYFFTVGEETGFLAHG